MPIPCNSTGAAYCSCITRPAEDIGKCTAAVGVNCTVPCRPGAGPPLSHNFTCIATGLWAETGLCGCPLPSTEGVEVESRPWCSDAQGNSLGRPYLSHGELCYVQCNAGLVHPGTSPVMSCSDGALSDSSAWVCSPLAVSAGGGAQFITKILKNPLYIIVEVFNGLSVIYLPYAFGMPFFLQVYCRSICLSCATLGLCPDAFVNFRAPIDVPGLSECFFPVHLCVLASTCFVAFLSNSIAKCVAQRRRKETVRGEAVTFWQSVLHAFRPKPAFSLEQRVVYFTAPFCIESASDALFSAGDAVAVGNKVTVLIVALAAVYIAGMFAYLICIVFQSFSYRLHVGLPLWTGLTEPRVVVRNLPGRKSQDFVERWSFLYGSFLPEYALMPALHTTGLWVIAFAMGGAKSRWRNAQSACLASAVLGAAYALAGLVQAAHSNVLPTSGGRVVMAAYFLLRSVMAAAFLYLASDSLNLTSQWGNTCSTLFTLVMSGSIVLTMLVFFISIAVRSMYFRQMSRYLATPELRNADLCRSEDTDWTVPEGLFDPEQIFRRVAGTWVCFPEHPHPKAEEFLAAVRPDYYPPAPPPMLPEPPRPRWDGDGGVSPPYAPGWNPNPYPFPNPFPFPHPAAPMHPHPMMFAPPDPFAGYGAPPPYPPPTGTSTAGTSGCAPSPPGTPPSTWARGGKLWPRGLRLATREGTATRTMASPSRWGPATTTTTPIGARRGGRR